MADLASDEKPSEGLANALGEALAPHFRFEKFLELASRRAFAHVEGDLFREPACTGPLNIAIAQGLQGFADMTKFLA